MTKYKLGDMAKGGGVGNEGHLSVNPKYKYQNTIKRWLDDHKSDSLKYQIAVDFLKGENNIDEKYNIETERWARVLRSLEKIGGESLHEMSWRTENYSTAEAEVWVKDALNRFFILKYAKGGGVGKLDVGVYRVGKPKKVSNNLYEQKIVEIFDNGDIATASDYGRKLSDFNSQKYPVISNEQFEAQYKFAKGGGVGVKRYKVYIYYGGGAKDKILYAGTLDEAKKLSTQGEHSEIIDTHTNEIIELYANGGGVGSSFEYTIGGL